MKEILKKHYEKIVLGVLALSFVFALLYLLQMLDSASTEEQLRFRTSKANYEIKDFASDEFKAELNLGKTDLKPREKAKDVNYHASLLVPMKALRCRNNDCQKMLPWDMARPQNNQNARCPHCEEELGDPGIPEDYDKVVVKRDSDNDGLPDSFERRMGLKPNDPQDATQDMDNDGFSNFYEYIAGTALDDPHSYPSLAKCLYLSKISRKKLKVKLESVIRIDSGKDPNKAAWDIALTVDNDYKQLAVGGEFTTNKKTFKVLSVEVKSDQKQEGGVVNTYDKHTIVLGISNNGKVDTKNLLYLRKDEPFYDLDATVTIRDVRDSKKRYIVSKGKSFSVTTEDKKNIKFTVIAADLQAKTVTLRNDTPQSGEENTIVLELVKNPKSLENAYTKKESSDSSDNADTPKKKKKKRGKSSKR